MELILIIKINVQFFSWFIPDRYSVLGYKVMNKAVSTSLVMKEMSQTNMSYLMGKRIMALDFTELSEHT